MKVQHMIEVTILALWVGVIAVLFTIGTQAAQIDPLPLPVYGYLRVCDTTGQFALRESPEAAAPVLMMLQNDDLVEPFNQGVTDSGGISWRRLRADTHDGWVRPIKASGAELTVCLGF